MNILCRRLCVGLFEKLRYSVRETPNQVRVARAILYEVEVQHPTSLAKWNFSWLIDGGFRNLSRLISAAVLSATFPEVTPCYLLYFIIWLLYTDKYLRRLDDSVPYFFFIIFFPWQPEAILRQRRNKRILVSINYNNQAF